MTIATISALRPISSAAAAAGEVKRSSLFSSSPPPNPTLKTITIRTRLSKLCQDGQPHLACRLFDTIPNPTTALWNTIIIGYVCNNMPLEALLFYARMKSSSPHPLTQCDAYTYSSTLKACADTGNLRLGKAVHCHLLRCSPQTSRISYNSLLNMYVSLCNVEEDYSRKRNLVKRVFDTMTKRDVVSWNTLISWYVKTERYSEAVKYFRTMIRLGIELSAVSFVNVLPAVSRVIDCNMVSVIYGMILKLGRKSSDDLFVVSSVILAFAEMGMLDYARKVFDNCPHKSTEIWNSMISGYIQNESFVEAVSLFIKAVHNEQKVADEVTFLNAITAVSHIQSVPLARQFHASTVKNFVRLPVNILNSLMTMYSRCNSIDSSFLLFDRMLNRDVVSWNTMISSLVNNGYEEEGLTLAYHMQKQNFKVDSVTVAAILSAASNLRNARVGKEVHGYLTRHEVIFEGIDSYLIDMYAKSGLISHAHNVFEKSSLSRRDLATWNAMAGGFSQHGLMEESFSTVASMITRNLMPNAVTIASILPGCGKCGSSHMVKQLHAVSIRHLLDQNIFLSTALVDTYSKTGFITYAERVFAHSKERNSVTYTSMIHGYGQHGMGEKAVSLFQTMNKHGSNPDSVSLTAVLSACSYAGLTEEGMQIFEEMEAKYGIQASTQHFCCVADMLGRSGRVAEAYEFVKQLGEKGEAMEIWGCVLGACKIHGYAELGEQVAKKMAEMENSPAFSGYGVLLSNIYAEEGSWETADQLRKEMRKKGVRKKGGYSWIGVAGNVTRFASKDQNFLREDEVYGTVELLFNDMVRTRDDSEIIESFGW